MTDDQLKKYAQVLVNYALNSGEGVRAGEVVQLAIPDVAKPLARELRNAVLRAGAHPMLRLIPTGFDRDFYDLANDDQLSFFPTEYLQAKAEVVDHTISIIADINPKELEGVSPDKIMLTRSTQKQYRDWLVAKENNGRFTWTVGLWPTQAKADIVGLSLDEYWQQIVQACFLDEPDPIAKWREVVALQEDILSNLNSLDIEVLHITGADVDLKVTIGNDRKWMGGSGRNIPSFEVFTSPDWRETHGWIRCNQPLYRYGSVIQNIYLKFENGIVVESSAESGESVLKEMIATENADKLGEFSLTDKRLSRISHPMAETLYDENIGGEFGNTHIALGMAYKDTYNGDPAPISVQQWKKMGFNDSAVHTDVISTTDRQATATLADGSQLLIYADGQFQFS